MLKTHGVDTSLSFDYSMNNQRILPPRPKILMTTSGKMRILTDFPIVRSTFEREVALY